MIEVKDIKKYFQGGDKVVKAVDGVSIKIEEGKFVSVIGKSGSGKSTLLTLLGALEKPTSGQVMIDENDINKMSENKLTIFRRDKIGFVFQNYSLIPNITALENVMIPMELVGLNRGARAEKAKNLLLEVGLEESKHNRRPLRLSGGEQQRVGIARALANKPSVILADEPTGNLDAETGKKIVELLKNLAKTEKTTVIIVTHDTDIAKISDEVYQIRDGKLVK